MTGVETAVDVDAKLHALGRARVERSCRVGERFFEAEADAVADACLAMARRFAAGGRLLVFGEGLSGSDAFHVSVEFVHPVLVGKRALPALAVTDDPAARIELLGRADDIALGISASPGEPGVAAGLARARQRGLLTIGLAGADGAALAAARPDHLFAILDDDPLVVQEVQETLYHVLWELVHVFFEGGVT